VTSPAVFQVSLDRVKATLLGLNLPFGKGQIEIRKLPWDRDMIYPGITIYPMPERESRGTCGRDDIGYGIGIAYVRPTTRNLSEGLGDIVTARQRVRRVFHNKRLPGFESDDCHVMSCKVIGSGVEIPKEFYASNDIGQQVIWAWFREYRTDPT